MLVEDRPQVSSDVISGWERSGAPRVRFKSFALLDPTKEETMRIFKRPDGGASVKTSQSITLNNSPKN